MRHAAEIFALIAMGLFTTNLGFAVAWARARERAKRAEGYIDGLRAGQPAQKAYDPAIDAIAMEVERIGEGQRFLTKVLTEQQAARVAPSRAHGSITPH
jgi:hypothetical protein